MKTELLVFLFGVLCIVSVLVFMNDAFVSLSDEEVRDFVDNIYFKVIFHPFLAPLYAFAFVMLYIHFYGGEE